MSGMQQILEAIDRISGTPEATPTDVSAPIAVARFQFLNSLVAENLETPQSDPNEFGKQLADEYRMFLESSTTKIPGNHRAHENLEGPFNMKNGTTVFYDSSADKYINADDVDDHLTEYGPTGSSAAMPPPIVPPKPGMPPPIVPPKPGMPPKPGDTLPNAAPQSNGTVTPQLDAKDMAIGFLNGMGNKNPSPADVTNMAKILGKGIGQVK